MIEVRTLRRGGHSEGEEIGTAFYHPGWDVPGSRPGRCLSTELPNGWMRRVFVDRDGRAVMTGWFWYGGW